MRATIHRDERGLTLTELLAVMAILGVLASLVFGAVAALGGKSQTARLEGDRETIKKAANQFFTEAFPETYPVVDLDDTDEDIVVTPDLDVRLIDFKAKLPQDLNTDFVPDFLTDIPDSTSLVSWRIDTNSGNAFFAADGSPLIRPSTNQLDIDAVDGTPGVTSDHELVLTMAKNEAALETLEIRVPASYSVGGQLVEENTLMGFLTATLDTDNEADSGQTIHFGGVLVTTATDNEWALVVNYNDNISTSGSEGLTVKTALEAVRVHTVSVVPPSSTSAGSLTLVMDRGDDSEANTATEIWVLTILGEATQELTGTCSSAGGTLPCLVLDAMFENPGTTSASGGLDPAFRSLDTTDGYVVDSAAGDIFSAVSIITNPGDAAVYRWFSEENTTISPEIGTKVFFDNVPGNQGVLIKE